MSNKLYLLDYCTPTSGYRSTQHVGVNANHRKPCISVRSHLQGTEDDRRRLDFVLPSGGSHYGLGLLHPSLREQPPRRLRDEPASIDNKWTMREKEEDSKLVLTPHLSDSIKVKPPPTLASIKLHRQIPSVVVKLARSSDKIELLIQ